MTKTVTFSEEEKSLLFNLILDNYPDDEETTMKFVTIYNKIAGVIK